MAGPPDHPRRGSTAANAALVRAAACCRPDFQRSADPHPLGRSCSHLERKRCLPLHDSPRSVRVSLAHVVPSAGTAARDAHERARQVPLPLPHVDCANGAGWLAHVRRGRRLQELRHRRPTLGYLASRRSAGCRCRHEGCRRLLPVGADRDPVLPVDVGSARH